MKRCEHPLASWLIEHLVLVYIAVVVSVMLPFVVVGLMR